MEKSQKVYAYAPAPYGKRREEEEEEEEEKVGGKKRNSKTNSHSRWEKKSLSIFIFGSCRVWFGESKPLGPKSLQRVSSTPA
jgi:hypothetical protein